jgi:cation transport protein ChaC
MRIEEGLGETTGEVDEREAALIEQRRIRPDPGKELRVFAYGSLMWKPDFPFLDVEPASLYGYHRAFCIESTHYRGTKERPGLVLGLDRGGMCLGRMFRVKPEHAAEVGNYLHAREMVGGVYEPKWLKLRLGERGLGERRATALGYVADRHNQHYAGKLDPAEAAKRIHGAIGRAGSNVDYLRNTVRHLEQMGIRECSLHDVLRRIEPLVEPQSS